MIHHIFHTKINQNNHKPNTRHLYIHLHMIRFQFYFLLYIHLNESYLIHILLYLSCSNFLSKTYKLNICIYFSVKLIILAKQYVASLGQDLHESSEVLMLNSPFSHDLHLITPYSRYYFTSPYIQSLNVRLTSYT